MSACISFNCSFMKDIERSSMSEFVSMDYQLVSLSFKVTGKQARDRVIPLFKEMENIDWKQVDSNESNEKITFVWETTCEIKCKDAHMTADILNRLNNSQV